MPRLIDADALLKRICELCGENCEMPNEAVTCVEWEFAHDAIESLPTVDAEPVVRCKDCKWFRFNKTAIWCDNERGLVEPRCDGFCSRGERREDA